MNKEEINTSLRHELIKALNEQYQKGFVDGIDEVQRLQNNTLTIKIPKGYKTLDTREFSEGDIHWIEIDLQEESKMCKIRQPHDGIDCPCNRAEKIEKGAKKFAEDFEGVMKNLSKE